MLGFVPYVLVFAALLVALGGCRDDAQPAQTQPASEAPAAEVVVPAAAVEYADLVRDLGRRAEKAEAVARDRGRSALVLTRAAAEVLALARLTADYDDYARAQSLLDDAFAVENAVPPYMMRAQLNFTLHRLDAAEADYRKQVELPGETEAQRAAEQLFAANLAYQRGDYETAKSGYEAVLAVDRTPGALAAMAYYARRTGAFDEAEALYRESLGILGAAAPEPVAWTHLQLGLMDLERGRFADALAHYEDGSRILAGYWLLQEHIAEIRVLQGDRDTARAAYVDLIDRTASPEFMDALAEILAASGDETAARTWVERASAVYAERMQRFPEATCGHALEHALDHGTPAEALALAEKNHALRPNTEAKTLLAQARLAAGDREGARASIEAALATVVRTAELHAVAAKVYEATGDAPKAAEQRALALAMNPRVLD